MTETIDLFEDENIQIWKDDDEIISIFLMNRGMTIFFTQEELTKLTNALIEARKKA